VLKPKCTHEKQSETAPTPGLFRIIVLFILAVSFIFSPDALPKIQLCFFHAITGLKCPGCGMTRAFCAISHGRFANAWSYNPFSFIFYALALLGLAYPSFINLISEKLTITIILTMTIALAVFGIFRILVDLNIV